MTLSPDFQTEREYREFNAINYSILKNLDTSLNSVIKPTTHSTRAMNLGTGVDILITQNKDVFYERFEVHTTTPKEPPVSIQKIFLACESWDQVFDEAKAQEYGGKWRDETIMSKLEDHKDWFELMLRAREVSVITPAEEEKIFLAATNITSNKFLQDVFESPLQKYYQFGIHCKVNGIVYKVLLDMMLVNEKEKKIYPFDLKTHDKSCNNYVENAFFLWRHDIQSSLYKTVLEARFPEYQIMDFTNIVYSFSTQKAIKVDTHKFYEKARKGYVRNGVIYKGWEQLTDDLLWHQEGDIWDYSREIYENNGVVVVC